MNKKKRIVEQILVSDGIKLELIGPNKRMKRIIGKLDNDYIEGMLEFAETDLKASEVLFAHQKHDVMYQAAYLSAQSVEKFLKAYLLSKSDLRGQKAMNYLKNFKHDLRILLNECIKSEKSFSELSENIAELEKFSHMRYPDVEDEYVYNGGLEVNSYLLNDTCAVRDFIYSHID